MANQATNKTDFRLWWEETDSKPKNQQDEFRWRQVLNKPCEKEWVEYASQGHFCFFHLLFTFPVCHNKCINFVIRMKLKKTKALHTPGEVTQEENIIHSGPGSVEVGS